MKSKKRKKAIALSYNQDMNAPKIVASGSGIVAENIINEAKKSSVPVDEENKLATILAELQVGDQIPAELYDVIAQILVFVGDMDELYAKTGRS